MWRGWQNGAAADRIHRLPAPQFIVGTWRTELNKSCRQDKLKVIIRMHAIFSFVLYQNNLFLFPVTHLHIAIPLLPRPFKDYLEVFPSVWEEVRVERHCLFLSVLVFLEEYVV